jgi:imidazolonepropionase-like amidohydrolase
MVLHVRGTVLPEREERSLWIDGGVLREDHAADADTVADGGWLLPGLVDVHTHPGAEKPGDPFDESVLHQHLAEHAAAGVLLIRAPGSAARIPGWAHDAEGLPRVRSAGPWLATPGRFFPGWGRHVTEAELAGAAAQEAAAALEAAAQATTGPRATPGPRTSPGTPPGPAATAAARTAHGPDPAPAPGPAPASGPGPASGWCKIIGDWAWTSRRCRWRFSVR